MNTYRIVFYDGTLLFKTLTEGVCIKEVMSLLRHKVASITFVGIDMGCESKLSKYTFSEDCVPFTIHHYSYAEAYHLSNGVCIDQVFGQQWPCTEEGVADYTVKGCEFSIKCTSTSSIEHLNEVFDYLHPDPHFQPRSTS